MYGNLGSSGEGGCRKSQREGMEGSKDGRWREGMEMRRPEEEERTKGREGTERKMIEVMDSS